MKKPLRVLRSIALNLIACGAVLAASAQAKDFSVSAGLRGRLPPSAGVAMILMERPRAAACAQAYAAAAQIEAPEHGGGDLSGSAHGAAGLLRGIGGDRTFAAAPGFDWIGDDLQSAYETFASASCQGAGLQMTPIVRIGSAAAPEPATWAMLMLGMATIGFAVRRRSRLRPPLAG